jgi:hypothetical protein
MSKKIFIKKCANWSIIIGAITGTLILFGMVYGSYIKPAIRVEAKIVVDSCKAMADIAENKRHEKIDSRLDTLDKQNRFIMNETFKSNCYYWSKLSKEERAEATAYFLANGGR